MSRNLQRVAVTDDGALDVKDLLRFERIVFTTCRLTRRSRERLGVQKEQLRWTRVT